MDIFEKLKKLSASPCQKTHFGNFASRKSTEKLEICQKQVSFSFVIKRNASQFFWGGTGCVSGFFLRTAQP